METKTTLYDLPTARTRTWQVLNLLGFLLMVGLNFLANWLPINGNTTGALSDKYTNLIVPAGSTFSIWGLIYLLVGVFTLYQLKGLFRTERSVVNTLVHNIKGWFFASSLLNACWIVAWHYELLPVSVAIMLVLLASLIRINLGLYNLQPYLSTGERFLTQASFGLYLGWICIATILNITTWLVAINWTGGLENDSWAVIMVVVGGLVVLYTSLKLINPYVALAAIWAFLGIIWKRNESELTYYSIIYTAAGMIFLLALAALYGFFSGKKHKVPLQHPSLRESELYR
ncbi:hypothetical protein GCM10027275_14090 [Rhabdobacter roseus]|uniref:Tryptophan-rich sensory protein n=1 Tax=Rhabdobacter roseus TaxID=1655419 RepID=A0A840TTH2_9BACT|nr:hypothetical protein [Rhabdobacter roseus]MBB5283328.1 hypothetical protein [Rhabdobacter roseus]